MPDILPRVNFQKCKSAHVNCPAVPPSLPPLHSGTLEPCCHCPFLQLYRLVSLSYPTRLRMPSPYLPLLILHQPPASSLFWRKLAFSLLPMQARLCLLTFSFHSEFIFLILQISVEILFFFQESLSWLYSHFQQMWCFLWNALIILFFCVDICTQILALPHTILSPGRSLLATLSSVSFLAE